MRHKSTDALKELVKYCLESGINHFETAAMYMAGKSERDYGEALSHFDRDSFILQTKVRPEPNKKQFRAKVLESMQRLRISRLDLLGFHGINHPTHFEDVITHCLPVARELQQEGLVGHVGFSSHAPTPLLLEIVESGLFDYVNLHYHFIGSYVSSGTSPTGAPDAGNLAVVQAATAADMGIFIISPFDKGGKLFDPPQRLVDACEPLTPMGYGALWLWRHPTIHTIGIGAETPSEMNCHLHCASLLGQAGIEKVLRIVDSRLIALQEEAGYDDAWRTSWWHGLPTCYEMEGGLNVPHIVWLWMLFTSFDLLWYTRERYDALEKSQRAKGWKKGRNPWAKVGDWTPGRDGSHAPPHLADLLRQCGNPYPEQIAHIVAEAHAALGKGGIEATAACLSPP